jgi:hypothetical protein
LYNFFSDSTADDELWRVLNAVNVTSKDIPINDYLNSITMHDKGVSLNEADENQKVQEEKKEKIEEVEDKRKF